MAAGAFVAAVLLGASPAAADQTVYFDDAGDAPHIGLIGDSTLTGVRWYDDYGDLERYNFVFSAESCRRTIEQSCISREGYRSANVLGAMEDLDGELGEVLVVMSGYNDPLVTIDDAIEAVVDEARSQGVGHVVWLSLRAGADVEYSDPQEQTSTDTFRAYNQQLHAAAVGSDGYLQVADWASYSAGADGWFESDGVHLTRRGVDRLTSYVADIVGRVLSGEDVTPADPPWTVLRPGAEGAVVSEVQESLLAAGLDLPGGADGEYGDATMVAVADFQRRHPGLDVTGAVDLATARALGVVDDPDAPRPTSVVAAPTTVAPTPAPSIGPAGATIDGGGTARWTALAMSGVVLGAVSLAVIARRRHVVRARRARRWARVHPATAPARSVADLRRAGELPTRPDPMIYDREREEAAAPGR